MRHTWVTKNGVCLVAYIRYILVFLLGKNLQICLLFCLLMLRIKDLHIITKTCLYNFDPLKPHFYIVKLGFTGV